MMLLPTLAVIFAGFTGGGHHHARVEKQVQGVVKALHVDIKPLPAAVVHSLTHHDATTRDRVRKLDVDAVIAAEVTDKGALRIVMYDRDGKLASFTESALTNDLLSADDLSVLRDNLETDLEPFLGKASEPAPAPAPAKKSTFDEEAELRSLGEDPKKTKTASKPVPPPPAPVVAKAPAKAPKAAPPTIDMDTDAQASDDESPLGNAHGSRPASATKAPAPASTADTAGSTPPEAETTTASAADDSGAVSASDIEAMMGSASETAETPASTTQPELHIGAEAGFGISQRSFATPSALAGYGSAPVGAVHLAVDVQPHTRMRLHLAAERTVGMTTPLDSGAASTVVSRWEATGGYAVTHGRIEISPQVGIGRRSFSIRSEDPNRSPDTSYNYLVVGARGHMSIGSRLGINMFAALEPVVSGVEGTEMALGEATRWAVDGGASVDMRFGHALVRAAADYQQFNWSWSMAGVRGSGGATDAYLTGSLSIGAEY